MATCTHTSPVGRWLKYCAYPIDPCTVSPASTMRLARAARAGALVRCSPIARTTAIAPMNQPMSACSWVTSWSAKWKRGTAMRRP